MIPLAATWGSSKHSAELQRYVVVGDTRLTAWFVGLVTTSWLCPSEGNRVNVGLKMLNKRDHDAARHLQYDKSSPAMSMSLAAI